MNIKIFLLTAFVITGSVEGAQLDGIFIAPSGINSCSNSSLKQDTGPAAHQMFLNLPTSAPRPLPLLMRAQAPTDTRKQEQAIRVGPQLAKQNILPLVIQAVAISDSVSKRKKNERAVLGDIKRCFPCAAAYIRKSVECPLFCPVVLCFACIGCCCEECFSNELFIDFCCQDYGRCCESCGFPDWDHRHDGGDHCCDRC